jgi:ABC-type Fe3+-hydroxamate transport system substrate-binding protein
LYDLGLEDSIVGITKFCIHPKHLRKNKTIVGGTKNCNFKKIKVLNPTHILCNKEENTKEIVEVCIKISHTHVSEIYTVNDSIELIKTYGSLFSKETQAVNLCEKIERKLSKFQVYAQSKPKLKIAYFIWKDPWMVAANNTYINHLLYTNKYTNYYENLERYPEVSIENIDSKELDVIFLSSEPFPFSDKHFSEIKSIHQNTKIILVDGEMFSWHGSRLIKAFDYFIELRESIGKLSV